MLNPYSYCKPWRTLLRGLASLIPIQPGNGLHKGILYLIQQPISRCHDNAINLGDIIVLYHIMSMALPLCRGGGRNVTPAICDVYLLASIS